MPELDVGKLKSYLSEVYGEEIEGLSLKPIRAIDEETLNLKEYGYGTPFKIDLVIGGFPRSIVFNTIKPGGFGHDRMSDRAGILLWQYRGFNNLPRHVEAVDVGAFMVDGSLRSLDDCVEFFLVTKMEEGEEYYRDLDRVRGEGLKEFDIARCEALADYLVDIHKVKQNYPGLYERRIRELVGDNECIFGITDSYPENLEYIKPSQLAEIEKKCIDWRWRLKRKSHRLSQVHGDYHPWNILFREGTDFIALDRSRGCYGEPADDVAGMTINYLFYALLKSGDLSGSFKTLWEEFYSTYFKGAKDWGLFEVIQPFLAWRALVIASPVWYPNLPLDLRCKLLNFANNILEVDRLDPSDNDFMNSLLEDRL